MCFTYSCVRTHGTRSARSVRRSGGNLAPPGTPHTRKATFVAGTYSDAIHTGALYACCMWLVRSVDVMRAMRPVLQTNKLVRSTATSALHYGSGDHFVVAGRGPRELDTASHASCMHIYSSPMAGEHIAVTYNKPALDSSVVLCVNKCFVHHVPVVSLLICKRRRSFTQRISSCLAILGF